MAGVISLDGVSAAGWLLGSVLGRTWRYQIAGTANLNPFRDNPGGRIFCFWHAGILPVLYLGRECGLTVLVSTSRDGTRLSAVLQRWGYEMIRGSSSRNGEEALRQCIERVSAGREIVITPDGPRGPARRMKRGVARIALETGVPVVPIALQAKRAWRLRSWDRFTIPWPFSTVRVAAGGPIDPALYSTSHEPLADLIKALESAMNVLDHPASP